MEYLEETKMYLSKKKSYKFLAEHMGCTSETAKRRVLTTIKSLIDFFEFKAKEIEFPYIKTKHKSYGFYRWQLGNCKEHSEFWIKVIQDYEDGVGSYKLPIIDHNESKISSLTISEFKELMAVILRGDKKSEQTNKDCLISKLGLRPNIEYALIHYVKVNKLSELSLCSKRFLKRFRTIGDKAIRDINSELENRGYKKLN